MIKILKEVGIGGWMKVMQNLGVTGVLLYLAWSFGNRLMDNDRNFREAIVQTQRDSTKAIQSVDQSTRGILEQEANQNKYFQEQAESRKETVKHLNQAQKFMDSVIKEETKQTAILEAILKDASTK